MVRILMRLFAFSAAIAALVAASGVFAAPSHAPANSPACKAALVMNLSDGALLAQHAPELTVAPASLTKIMSLFVLFDAMEKGENQHAGSGAHQCGGGPHWGIKHGRIDESPIPLVDRHARHRRGLGQRRRAGRR